MVTRTTDKIPEYYDEGFLPWPWPEDEVPERIPIEMMQAPAIRYLWMLLSEYYGLGPTMFSDTNIPIRFDPSNRRVFIAPDICLAFDVDAIAIGIRESYDLWEVGKPPDFVLEVASRSTYRKDLYEKPEIYAYIGAGEYWLFDPTGGELYGQALTGYQLVNGIYEPIEIAPNEHGVESGYSAALGLRLCSVTRSRQSDLAVAQPGLVFFDNYHYPVSLLVQEPDTGLYLVDVRGQSERAEQAEARAENAEMQAEQAEARAEQVEARAKRAEARAENAEAENAKLRERLRQLEQGR